METSFSTSGIRAARAPLSQFSKLTLGAMAGVAALLVYSQAAVFGGFDPMVSGVAGLALALGGLVLSGRRWAAIPATVLAALLLALLAMMGGEIAFTLAHPGGGMFTFILLALIALPIALASGIAATVQNYRGRRGRAAWLPVALALVAGLAVGAIVVANVPRADAAGASAETLAALPAVTLDNFDGGEIHVTAGETAALRLENPDGVTHAFVVDELGVNALMPAGQNSLALFMPSTPGTYTFYCTPHYDKASGQGMHGTLVVE